MSVACGSLGGFWYHGDPPAELVCLEEEGSLLLHPHARSLGDSKRCGYFCFRAVRKKTSLLQPSRQAGHWRKHPQLVTAGDPTQAASAGTSCARQGFAAQEQRAPTPGPSCLVGAGCCGSLGDPRARQGMRQRKRKDPSSHHTAHILQASNTPRISTKERPQQTRRGQRHRSERNNPRRKERAEHLSIS